MSNTQIPKRIEKLLKKRAELGMQLMDVCSEIDEYCEQIGVDMVDSCANGVSTDVTIYCEPYTAFDNTRKAIQKALGAKMIGGEQNG